MVSPLPMFLSALTFGEQPEHLLPLCLTKVWDAQERRREGKTPAGGQILALPAPGCSPHHPPDLLTQGLQCGRVTQALAGQQGLLTKAKYCAGGAEGAHSSHTRILTVPEHALAVTASGLCTVLPFQTEMSFDAISLLPWG